jgi:hypothetical protein
MAGKRLNERSRAGMVKEGRIVKDDLSGGPDSIVFD